MKRLNRKKLIEEVESLRQGFRDLINFGELRPVNKFSAEAYHEAADRLVVELGGESVL
jgi:hypothetical protein